MEFEPPPSEMICARCQERKDALYHVPLDHTDTCRCGGTMYLTAYLEQTDALLALF